MIDQPSTVPLDRKADSFGDVATPGALVIGGAHGSLAVVRSLGRHGIPVCVVTHDNPIATFSRYATHRVSWPGPDHPGALDFLLRQVGSRAGVDVRGWVIFTGGDAEAEFVSRHYTELSAVFRLTGSPWQVTRCASDKRLTYRHAAEVGVDAPWSYYPRDRDDVARLDCRFPLILKPTVKGRPNAFTLAKAWRVDDRAALMARFDQAAAMVGEQASVLQELIPGGGATQFSYAAAWRDGAQLASLVARRTRQYPIDFGYTSSFVETIEHPAIEEAACRFLKPLGYSGLVEVEFKFDERDGRYKILDVNARTWTWAALGAAAGVDLPYLLWHATLGNAVAQARGRPGAAWMHLARDVAAVCQQLARGRVATRDPSEALSGPIVFAAFAADDPLPGIVDLPLTAWRASRTRLPMALAALRARSMPSPPIPRPR